LTTFSQDPVVFPKRAFPRRRHRGHSIIRERASSASDKCLPPSLPVHLNAASFEYLRSFQVVTHEGLRVLQKFCPMFRREGLGFTSEVCLCRRVKLGRRRDPSCDRHADLSKEVLLAGWRADAEQTDWFRGDVVKMMMRWVCLNVDGIASAYDQLLTAEGGLNLAFEQDEGFFEVMPRRKTTLRRNVYIDQ
jgi:hypothetical protein